MWFYHLVLFQLLSFLSLCRNIIIPNPRFYSYKEGRKRGTRQREDREIVRMARNEREGEER